MATIIWITMCFGIATMGVMTAYGVYLLKQGYSIKEVIEELKDI